MRFLILVIFLITQLNIYAQTYKVDINFDHENEKGLFQNYSEETLFELLYLVDNESISSNLVKSKKAAFYSFLDKIKDDVFSKKRKKTASNLYKKIHNAYFIKYVDNPIFSDIFTKKEYNCVTASSLYALALEYYEIPYEIRETPIHIYLVLYPNADKIIYESTTPGSSVISISKKEIENYKQSLIAQKIITPEEGKSEDFFNDYYLADSTINMKQLTAIHYSNNGIRYGENENYIKAVNQLEKAYQYYETETFKQLINYYSIMYLEEIKDEKVVADYCTYFSKLAHYIGGIDNYVAEVSGLYYTRFNNSVKTKEDKEYLINIQNCLDSQIEHDSLRDKINEVSNALISDYYYTSADFDNALKYLIKIYNPEVNVFKLMAKDCVLRKLSEVRNPEKGLDSLKKYTALFPFIEEDKHFLGFQSWCKLKIIHMHFELNEYDEGVSALNEFRQIFKPNADIVYSEDLVGAGFGSASAYFVRKQDYKKAKALLLEGLEYDSFNIELKRRLKLLYETFPNLKEE